MVEPAYGMNLGQGPASVLASPRVNVKNVLPSTKWCPRQGSKERLKKSRLLKAIEREWVIYEEVTAG
jgi:hypothetical protein